MVKMLSYKSRSNSRTNRNTTLPELAFASILALLGLASAVALLFARRRATRWSALLSLPLVAWLCFASFLAFSSMPR
jgi:tryptophan-rich sensory protein